MPLGSGPLGSHPLGGLPPKGKTQNIACTGFVNATLFGESTVTNEGGLQSIVCAGIDSTNAFGSPVVTTGAASIACLGVLNLNDFGSPTVAPGSVGIVCQGIAGLQAFGLPTVSVGAATIVCQGIPSENAFGLCDVALTSIDCVGDCEEDPPTTDGMLKVPSMSTGRPKKSRPIQVIDSVAQCADRKPEVSAFLTVGRVISSRGACLAPTPLVYGTLVRTDRLVLTGRCEGLRPGSVGTLSQDMQPIFDEEQEILELLEVAGILN